jgi:hypothetical protein
MTEEFSHLFPFIRPIAALSAEERIRRIRADRWIAYPRAEQALKKLEALLAFPQRARMPNLLIVGASGMGKTMIVEKFARDHPSHFDAVTGRMRMPVIVVQMVPGPDEARFYKRLLAAIGAPEPPRATLSALESLALRLLSEIQPGLLIIDEVHSLQAGTVREQARFLNMLRFLGNELRIPLICVGTQQARNALRRPRPNIRVTRGHFDQPSGSRVVISSSKRPYGLTCSHISGVKALRSVAVNRPCQWGWARTSCSMSVFT